MEQKFIDAWESARQRACEAGVRIRPVNPEDAMKTAHRCLTGSRVSEGFFRLADIGHLEWSLEALAVDSRWTALFNDAEADEALRRLMDAGYY